MGLLEFDPPQRYLELIGQFRLIDDTFFDVCFDGNIEGMQLLLRIFFHRDDIIVKEVISQRSATNLYGRSTSFDVIAVDSKGKIYNVEIQRSNEGANPKRARFNNSLIDSREINKNTAYKDFPEVWIIFITEHDIFGANLPMYHVERNIMELNKPFSDAAHVIYVNGDYKANDELGLLMRDFFCPDPSKMHYPELAKRVDFFKNDEKGVSTLCEIMEKLQEEGRREGHQAGLAEGEKIADRRTASKLLAKNMSVEEVLECVNLSKDEILELAGQN
ncbi:PD-(D/E)XK nuclease family transposase [Anaerovibrio sp.]|uniref:PD-(D/E)XK nuclease family transposase n=1 Tax=Anaerovibrio sp. TaxID=1872532 RepID=UPI00388D01F5